MRTSVRIVPTIRAQLQVRRIGAVGIAATVVLLVLLLTTITTTVTTIKVVSVSALSAPLRIRQRRPLPSYSSFYSSTSTSTSPACSRTHYLTLAATKKSNQDQIQNNNAVAVVAAESGSKSESYTNYWDHLLLEEHKLALQDWRDRLSKCSPQTLEKRGLALGIYNTRAFALPDSEVLGEKTVRIHNGMKGNSDSSDSNGNSSRLRRPWNELFGKGDVLELTTTNGGGTGGGGLDSTSSSSRSSSRGGFSSSSSSSSSSTTPFRRECLVMDVGDTWMLVGVGKTWPQGLWDARKGGSSGGNKRSSFGRASNAADRDSYGYPVQIYKTPNAAALIPLRAQRSALQTIRESSWSSSSSSSKKKNGGGGGGPIATWLTKTGTGRENKGLGFYQLKNRKQYAKKLPHHYYLFTPDDKNEHENEINKKNNEDEIKTLLATTLQEAMQRVTTTMTSTNNRMNNNNWNGAATANESQREAITWALSRRVSSIQGPPGTGKTRVAALLIATALEAASSAASTAAATTTTTDDRLRRSQSQIPFRVLAVAHSNGAADVLLEALLELGVPAVRAGRPAAMSEKVRHRSAAALAEKMPQVELLRRERRELLAAGNANNNNNNNNIEWELQKCIADAEDIILDSAPVVVTSCVGAYQLSVRQDKLREEQKLRRRQTRQQQQQQMQQDGSLTNKINNNEEKEEDDDDDDDDVRFPLVVLDEAAQCTEPALVCALVAARAEQLVLVGDTKQLPPTVASSSKELRESLGMSPMERLEKSGLVEQKTLQIQYRMVQALLEHPSNYFYNGLVKSATPTPTSTSTTKTSTTMTVEPTTTISGSFAPSPPSSPPAGFAWPVPSLPLAFVRVGRGDAEVLHDSSLGLAGRSNPTEAEWVARIVADILEAGELTAAQICVLTPYSKQVSVIRSTLQEESLLRRRRRRNYDENNNNNEILATSSGVSMSMSMSMGVANTALNTATAIIAKSINDVRVGTVDSFQGQETEVVIFSAVRSNNFSELGFLRDPRRLCVALTRAKKGLIVLGDPTTLKSCRHWGSLIQSCQDRKCLIDDVNDIQPFSSDRMNCDDIGEGISDNNNNNNDNDDGNERVLDRGKVSLLDLEDEFLGLFTTPSNRSSSSQ